MSRDELVRVELKDGTICRMAKKAFCVFLSQGKIVKFEGSDGWAFVGEDTLGILDGYCNFSVSEPGHAV